MKIYIVRHGESELNINDGYLDKADCDIELTDKGIEQAKLAGKALSDIIDSQGKISNNSIKVLVSPYKRAKETFNTMNKYLNIPDDRIFEEDLLVEHSYGIFHGTKDFSSNYARYKDEYLQYNEAERKNGRFFNSKTCGESEFDVVKRAKILIESLHREIKEENLKAIILVTHHNFIRCFIKAFFRKSMDWYNAENGPDNCSIQLIEDNVYRGYIHGNKKDNWII